MSTYDRRQLTRKNGRFYRLYLELGAKPPSIYAGDYEVLRRLLTTLQRFEHGDYEGKKDVFFQIRTLTLFTNWSKFLGLQGHKRLPAKTTVVASTPSFFRKDDQ